MSKTKHCNYLLLLLVLFCITPQASVDKTKTFGQTLYKVGDNANWKQPEFIDEHWTNIKQGLPKSKVLYWVRLHVNITAKHLSEPQAIYTSILGAHEIYWNGALITSTGKVATTKDQELPGNIQHMALIPPNHMTLGEHVIALRISNQHSPEQLRSKYFNVFIIPYEKSVQRLANINIPALLALGGLLVIGLYFLQLYFVFSSNPTHLVFAILCLNIATLLIAERWKQLMGYGYDWHLFRLQLISVLTFCVACLMPTFLLFHYQISVKKRWFSAIIGIILAVWYFNSGYDQTSMLMLGSALFISLAITTYAIHLGRRDSKLIAVVITPIILLQYLYPSNFQDQYFFPCFALLILVVLQSLTQQMKVIQQQRDDALLSFSQLKISLLKKNIQPHFILNTLTSIEQWIEESPKTAIAFIDALANEFSLLNTISDKRAIALWQEVQLCQLHLQIMSYRQDKTFELVTEHIEPEQTIPPAVLHTLIENILSHNRFTEQHTTIWLQQQPAKQPGMTVLTIKSPIELPTKPNHVGTGTGLEYINARLTDCFGKRWQLEQMSIEGYWHTKVYLPTIEHQHYRSKTPGDL